MTERLSAWALKERLGKMRASAFQQWLDFGLVPPPDEDGRWDSSVEERIHAAQALGRTKTRTLSRRALLLQLEDFPLPVGARRTVVVDVLRRVRPASAKMAQVRREFDVFERQVNGRPAPGGKSPSLRIGIEPAIWVDAVLAADDQTFQQAYEAAARWALRLPGLVKSTQRRQTRVISYEERLVLLVVLLVLRDPGVRNNVGVRLAELKS